MPEQVRPELSNCVRGREQPNVPRVRFPQQSPKPVGTSLSVWIAQVTSKGKR